MSPDLTTDLVRMLFGVGFIMALLAIIWKNFEKRTERVEEQMSKKATVEMVKAVADSVADLAHEVKVIRESEHSTNLILARMDEKMGREQVSRERFDRRLDMIETGVIEELRALRQALVTYGRRRNDGLEDA